MSLSELVKVPGITPSGALLVYAIGYTGLEQLKDKDALDMYDSVIERLAIRSTDCRLLSAPRSKELKREISALPDVSETEKEIMSRLSDRLSKELFGREKRQILINAMRLATSYATLGPLKVAIAPDDSSAREILIRHLALAHIAENEISSHSPEELYDRIFSSVDLVPETAEVLRVASGLAARKNDPTDHAI